MVWLTLFIERLAFALKGAVSQAAKKSPDNELQVPSGVLTQLLGQIFVSPILDPALRVCC